MYYLLFVDGNNGFTNATHCYVILTLSVLFPFPAVSGSLFSVNNTDCICVTIDRMRGTDRNGQRGSLNKRKEKRKLDNTNAVAEERQTSSAHPSDCIRMTMKSE
jgi:hypothetical protein